MAGRLKAGVRIPFFQEEPACSRLPLRMAAYGVVPVSGTVWTDPAALSLIVSDAAYDPLAGGTKATMMVQEAAAFNTVGQLLTCWKDWAPVPVKAI